MTPSIVALIPARAGSKRCPGKNTRLLGGKPLIQWTIDAAHESGIFRSVNVCTDSRAVLDLSVPPTAIIWRDEAPDDQPDIAWVTLAFEHFSKLPDAFAILRPTSPFRTAATIQRAWQQFQDHQPCDSIRAVEMVRQHPLKMWLMEYPGKEMKPLLPHWTHYSGLPEYDSMWHSRPTQTLPACYVQNASLEIAWTNTVMNRRTIAGDRVMPFLTEGHEGVDINTEEDFMRAERIAALLPA